MSLEDIELAIEDLDKLVEIARENYNIVGYLGVVHSANFIIETLEKQIPKELSWEGPTNDAKDDAEAYCPKCDYYFKDETSYCPDCGQKILWP